MNSNNNNTKWLKNVKPCPNHCRTWIAYNERLNRFVEAKNGEIHHCPKWKPNSNQQRKTPYKKIRTLKRDEVTYVDTIGPAIAEILSTIEEILKLIRKIHGSIAKFQGGIGQMGMEINEHEQWTKIYLVDHLKQHLATFEVAITPSDDKRVYDNRKYYQQAHESLIFGALKPAPPFVIYLSDLSPKIIRELYGLDRESRKYVLKQAVGRIFEDVNSELYHSSISKVLEVKLKDG